MKLIQVSIFRPVFISMVALFLAVLGILALNRLPLDLYPAITYPVLTVRADLSGAAPEEMEQLVTKRLEDTLSTLAGIKAMRSVSREGSSMVSLEFDLGADIRFQEIQARAKIANMRRSLPSELSEPVVYRQDPDEAPILSIAISGNRTASELTEFAEDVVARRIRQLEGVGDLDISGERSKEIRVDLRPDALDVWKLNATDVVQAIGRANRNDPVGRVRGESNSWIVRSVAQSSSVADLAGVNVGRTHDGNPIFLRDVATIDEGYAEVNRMARIHDETGLHPAVVVDVLKQSGENTVAVSDRVRTAVQELRDDLPPGVTLRISRDNADLIRTNVADVYESLIIAVILTVAVVLFFLQSYRSTITTGLALPSSVITTFAVMSLAGFTINTMTLLALSLSIGLLVDDAIVVRENIYRHLRIDGQNGRTAAYNGAREVALAVIATTTTLIAVFLPVAFMGGITGQFFKSFALTVVFAMLVSLWDSLTMAPMLSAWFANIPDPGREWAIFGAPGRAIYRFLHLGERGFDAFEKGYAWILAKMIPRWWISLVVGAGAIAAAVVGFQMVKTTFLPAQLDGNFQVNMSGPLGQTNDTVFRLAEEADRRVAETGLFTWWTMSSGVGFGGDASVNFNLRTKPELAKDQESLADVRQKVRRALGGFPGYNVRVSEPSDPLAGGRRFQPVAITVSGDDFKRIQGLMMEARQVLRDTPGIVDVPPVQDLGVPEVRLRVDPLLAAQYGVTAAQASENLRLWTEGNASNRLRVGDDQIPIRVRLAEGERMAPGELLQRSIYLRSNGRGDVAVPLASFMRAEVGSGPATISRENRQRTLRVGASLESGAALGDVVKNLKERLKAIPLPQGYSIQVVGQNQQMEEATQNIVTAILIGSLFVYMVLASLFESFILPITVMSAIPLAATGAVWALILFGIPLDLYGGIGMVLLAGIVAKNSILMVDFANRLVHVEGRTPGEAVLVAAPRRLRPILMTSFAMIAGMIPVAAGLGATGEARRALGIATIGGVISSTVLTLLVVPNFFIFMERFRRLFRRSEPAFSEERKGMEESGA